MCLCTVEVSRNRHTDWIIGHWWLIWISVSFTLPRGAETTNLYSPHWVLSTQSWVFGIPLVYGYRIVFQKSSPDLWKRVHFKSFRTPASWNRNGSNMDKIEIVKRQQGKGPGDFCNIVSAMVPHPTVQGLCFWFPWSFPILWLKVFWLTLIIQNKHYLIKKYFYLAKESR